MSFLHKLWDETLAGPAPDTGLSKLRKSDSSLCPPITPIIATVRPSSDSDLFTSRSPTGDFEKFVRGKSTSSVQSPVRGAGHDKCFRSLRNREKDREKEKSELHEILTMEEEEE